MEAESMVEFGEQILRDIAKMNEELRKLKRKESSGTLTGKQSDRIAILESEIAMLEGDLQSMGF